MPHKASNSELEYFRVWLVYRRPLGVVDTTVQWLGRCGEFTHMELYFPNLCRGYCNFMFNNMEENQFCLNEYEANPEMYTVQEIFMFKQAHDHMHEWCKSRVDAKTTYNYISVVRLMLPQCMHASIDPPECNKLFCSEAAVLALRASFSKNDSVVEALQPLVAVSSKPCDVANALLPVLGEPKEMKTMLLSRHLALLQ